MSTEPRVSETRQSGSTQPLPKLALRERPGRWLDGYDPEDQHQWETQGQAIARTNLKWSIFAEFLGFAVWKLWAVVVVFLPRAGYAFTDSQLFWLISMPSLIGATLRVPYTFMVGRFGGRNWTVVSAVGAYGGFAIPQVLSASKAATGQYDIAFYGFVGFYILALAITWACYLRPGTAMAAEHI